MGRAKTTEVTGVDNEKDKMSLTDRVNEAIDILRVEMYNANGRKRLPGRMEAMELLCKSTDAALEAYKASLE